MSAKDSKPIIVFCDGACSGNPGPGGWACIIATPEKIVELGGHVEHTTNNKMEITAAGKALRFLEKTPGLVQIYTDSKYVIQGITEWAPGWEKRGWKKADNKPVLNEKFWQRLLELVRAREKKWPVEWHYVEGHSGNPGNDRCDEIAVLFSKRKPVTLYNGPAEDYPVKLF